jgi:hypothetical protein
MTTTDRTIAAHAATDRMTTADRKTLDHATADPSTPIA